MSRQRSDPNETPTDMGPLFRVDPKALARTTDPPTSKAAAVAAAATTLVGDEQRRALDVLEQHPGSTANELSDHAGDRDPRRINRRLGELERAELAHRRGRRADLRTGKAGFVWYPGPALPGAHELPKGD